jgi:hypothetical protein
MVMCQFVVPKLYPYCGLAEAEFDEKFVWHGWID